MLTAKSFLDVEAWIERLPNPEKEQSSSAPKIFGPEPSSRVLTQNANARNARRASDAQSHDEVQNQLAREVEHREDVENEAPRSNGFTHPLSPKSAAMQRLSPKVRKSPGRNAHATSSEWEELAQMFPPIILPETSIAISAA